MKHSSVVLSAFSMRSLLFCNVRSDGSHFFACTVSHGCGNSRRPSVVGLIGGIASGKSTVSKALGTACGLEVIDADKLGHESYQPGTRCFGKLVDAFGEKIVAGDGTIDRRALGQAVRCRSCFGVLFVPACCGTVLHPLQRKTLHGFAIDPLSTQPGAHPQNTPAVVRR